MKLKDLTVDLSRNDNSHNNRSLNIGPLSDGLNFIYGERGAGKSTIRNLVSELLLDSSKPNLAQRAAANRNKIRVVVDTGSGRFQIVRDLNGDLSSTLVNGIGTTTRSTPAVSLPSLDLDRELADSFSFVTFRNSESRQERMHATLQNRFRVPLGPDAAMGNVDAPRLQQQRIQLQSQIDALHSELTQLRSQRAAIDTESSISFNDINTAELDRQIALLTTQLGELDPNRIRLEMDSLQQEAARLRLDISNTAVTVEKPQPSQYVPTLYRLLDEIDQQIREVRIVQSNVQRHRVRLKEEMEFRNSVSVDETNHPYHRAREILRQIESRINNADTRGDQWLEDHGTVDAKQVSNFLDETCRSVRDDLQTLCDELSNQYRELRNHSATYELKELRHNFTHLSELIQQLLGRRDSVVAEINVADPAGADAIRRAAPEFCQLAVASGHLAARQQYVGPVSDLIDRAHLVNRVTRDTSLQQQQLAALENRLAALRASLDMADSESIRITREINDLTMRKSSLATMHLTQRRENTARLDEQIRNVELNIRSLTDQLAKIPLNFVTPHPLLVTASNILQHLTSGDYLRVWLGSDRNVLEVQDRHLKTHRTGSIAEAGISQLVHLSLVLAANETNTSLNCPLILDGLFSDLKSNRVDPALETLSRWCSQNMRQVLLLTQHRFLADRLPDSPVWVIEPETNASNWRPATQETLNLAQTHVANLTKPHTERTVDLRHEQVYSGTPIAEYPRSPLPRPYPLSKYPRTTDRDRVSDMATLDQYETYANVPQPQPKRPAPAPSRVPTPPRTVTANVNEFATRMPIQKTEVVSPSTVGDRIKIATINDSTRIDSVSLFDAAQLRCLENNNIITVGEFLLLESASTTEEFVESYLTGKSLEHLQASAWLMNFVPGLSANDAQALVACGISEPEHLLTSNIDSLFERVSRFLRSPDGRRFSNLDRTLDRNAVHSWQQRLRDNPGYRHQSRPRHSSSRQSTQRRHSLRAWSPNERTSSSSDDRQPRTRTRVDSDRSRQRSEYDRSERERSREQRAEYDRPREQRAEYDRSREHGQRERSQDRTSYDRTRQDRVERDHTRQDRTRQDRNYRDRDRDRDSTRQRQTVSRESMPIRSPRMRTPEPREPRQEVPPIEPRVSRPRERSRTARKPDAVRQNAGRQSIASLNETTPVNSSSRKSQTKSKSKSDKPKLRFYLDLADHIEAAPSIGPKTGARFEAIGVHTISDFLKITAESLAEKLNYKRLSAKVVRQYQNQTRLVCRIPNLRGHDAQLLVGCGVIEAEELASMRPEILFAKVAPFSNTKEGLKIIRNGKKPDLEEITDWISFAQHNRSLQAA